MADISTNIVIRLVDQITAPLKKITNDFEVFRAYSKRADEAFKWGKNLNQSYEAASRFSNKIKNLTEDPIKLAESAEVAFVGLQRRTGLTGEAFDKLKARVAEVGAGSDWDLAQTAQGLTTLMKRGFDTTQAFQQLPAILDLAEGANIDLGAAVEMTTGILNKFGASSLETTRYTDVMTKAASLSGFGMNEFGGSLDSVAKASKLFGVNFETTAGLLGVFSKAAGSTTVASGALNTVFDHMASPRGAMQVGKGLQFLYGSTVNVKEKISDIPKLMEDVTDKVKDLDNATKAKALKLVFGTTDIAAMITAAGPGGLGAIVASMQNVSGASAKAAAMMGGTATMASEKYEASMKRLQAVLGAALLPSIIKFKTLISGIIDGITAWTSKHETLAAILMRSLQIIGFLSGAVVIMIAGLAGLAAAVGVVNLAIGTHLTGAIILKALPAMLSLNAAMLANPIGLIVVGIAAVVAGIVFLTIHFDKLTAMWERFKNASLGVKIAIMAMLSPLLIIAAPIVALVSAMIGIAGVARKIIDNWTPIKEFFSGLWASITAGIDKAMAAVDLLANNPLINRFLPIKAVASGMHAVGGGIGAVGSGIAGLAGGVADVFAGSEPTLTPRGLGEYNSVAPVGGRLDIHVTADGQAKVIRAEPTGNMPWSVNTGLGMVTP